MTDTPFDQTLFLDSDVYVFDKLEEVFILLDKYDMAMAHAPFRQFIELNEVPSSFSEFNTGVILFNKSEKIFAFFSEWLLNFYQLNCKRDQPAFRKAIYDNNDIRHYTLIPEFNCRFNMIGYVCDNVNFLHGRAKDITAIERAINERIEPRVHFFPDDFIIHYNEQNNQKLFSKLYNGFLKWFRKR